MDKQSQMNHHRVQKILHYELDFEKSKTVTVIQEHMRFNLS